MKKYLVTFCFAVLTGFPLWADTITVGGTALVNPTTYPATSGVFTYYGFLTTNYPSAGGNIVSTIGISSTNDMKKFPPVQVGFDLTGTNFEVIINNYDYANNFTTMPYFTVSDGVTTTIYTNVPYLGPSNTNTYSVPVTFSSGGTHAVRLSVKGNFGGVRVAAGNTISASSSSAKPNLLIVEGDSYTEGYNPTVLIFGYPSYWFDGWVWQLARLVPNTIAVPSSIGGSGFVSSNGGATPTFGQRVVADICSIYNAAVASGKYNQIFITASGSINDIGADTNTLYAAATNVYTILKNNCPQARVFFVGNWLGVGGRTTAQADDLAKDKVLSAAAATVGVPYMSPVLANIRNAGNYNVFFPPVITDSVHPTAAGYAIMAQWVNTNLSYTFGTNWDANSQQGGGILKYNLTVNNGSGSGSYTNGQIVSLTATNIFGSYFTNWSGATSTVANPGLATTTITMPAANIAVTANLVVIPTTASVNVTDYGAKGDAVRFAVQTTSNSAMVSVLGTNRFSSADIGKVIEVFRAGPWLRFSNNPAKPFVVTNQDTICLITNVTDGTNLWGSIPQGWTKQADCVVGSNNRLAFQAAIDFASANVSATNRNVTLNIPNGTYLIVGPKVLNPNYWMELFDTDFALSISTGGLTLSGESTNAVLLGCGAGMNHVFNDATVYGGYGHFNPLRGTLLQCLGPITNSQYPLVVQNLTFDGGVANALQAYSYFTIVEAGGDGWDTSHHAFMDRNPYNSLGAAKAQMHQLKIFTNCVFQHWRGEMMINVTGDAGGTNTFIDLANCTFFDGNASAINLYFGQHIHGCTFQDLVKVEEYYQSHATLPSVFENNVWTNIVGSAFSIVGSTINGNPPSYTFRNNQFYGVTGNNQFHFAPAENVLIVSNVFKGQAYGVVFSGIGVQPTDGTASIISNIVVICNQFNNSAAPILMDGYPVSSVLISNNTSAVSGAAFASLTGGWKTNILFTANTSAGWLDASRVQAGNYPVDASDNQLAPLWWDNGAYAPTNAISYGSGRSHKITKATAKFFLDDTQPALIPAGATLTILNSDATPAMIYASGKTFLTLSSGPTISLPPGQSVTCSWTNGFWRRISQTVSPTPPYLHQ
jgi:lysophospholipase L1-like esterase